jgi:hypothetical protein
MDRWLAHRLGPVLRSADAPVVVDLGYGASPVTAVELLTRLRAVNPSVRVLGLEIDPRRVAAAAPHADPPTLTFARGGFELAGSGPLIVRAANVLRQYDEATAARAWLTVQANLADGGYLVEGTCDEIGRIGSWVLLDSTHPLSLTFAVRIASLQQPSRLAERLPKALIHHNVRGQPIHELLRALDAAWLTAAPLASFGARQRWIAACERLSADWPVLDCRSRWRLGELTVAWPAVAVS